MKHWQYSPQKVHKRTVGLTVAGLFLAALVCLASPSLSQQEGPDVLLRLLQRGVEHRESLIQTIRGYFVLIHLRNESAVTPLPPNIRIRSLPYPIIRSIYYASDGRRVRYEESGVFGPGLAKPEHRQTTIVLNGEFRYVAEWTGQCVKNGSVTSKIYRTEETYPRALLGLDDGSGVLLSRRLREAKEPPRKELYSGKDCYRAITDTQTFWICPDLGYAPIRIETKLNPENPTTRRLDVVEFLDFHKYGQDIWIPHESISKTFLVQADKMNWEETILFKTHSLEVNASIDESEFILRFPVGTRVSDERGSYTVGPETYEVERVLKDGKFPWGLNEKDIKEP